MAAGGCVGMSFLMFTIIPFNALISERIKDHINPWNQSINPKLVRERGASLISKHALFIETPKLQADIKNILISKDRS